MEEARSLSAFLFVGAFRPFLAAGFGFAAGAMTWLVVSELLPAARASAPPRAVAGTGVAAYAAMMALQLALGG